MNDNLKPSIQLDEIRDWLVENRLRVASGGAIEDLTAHLEDLARVITRVEDQESLILCAWEFMSGEWAPDDIDRARFTADLARASGEVDDV